MSRILFLDLFDDFLIVIDLDNHLFALDLLAFTGGTGGTILLGLCVCKAFRHDTSGGRVAGEVTVLHLGGNEGFHDVCDDVAVQLFEVQLRVIGGQHGQTGNAWNSVINWWHDNAYEDGQFTIQGLLDGILTAMANIGTWIYDNILQPFLDGFGKVFGVESLSTIMAEYGGNIISGLYQGITDGWKTIQQWLTDLPGKFKSAFNEVTSWVSTTFAGAWEAAWGGLQTGVVNAVNGVIGVINDMLQTVADGVNKLFSMLNFSIDMPGIFGGGTVGFEVPTVSAPQIPYLATGAVIPPNAPFYAVLGDQRHGNNIEAPEDLIRKIVREEAGSFGNDRVEDLLETLISVVRSIHIGDDDIGQAAQRYIRSSERTMGGY